MQTFLEGLGIHKEFLSGFKIRHIIVEALLRVFNDVLFTADSDVLDLTATFDTVNHYCFILSSTLWED